MPGLRKTGDRMKVLVAGATGAIGVRPVRALAAGGHQEAQA
jgi:nucleoside-diphosphate-sugar epimerase